MSKPKNEQYKYRGKFAIKKNVESKKKKLIAMAAARQKKLSQVSQVENLKKNEVLEGCRIVDMNELAKNLKCHECNHLLDLQKAVKEKRRGLHSTFNVQCDNCKRWCDISTSQTHYYNNKTFSDINTSAVLGAVHSGTGHTSLQKVFACLNMPGITSKMYKMYEEKVGQSIEQSAQESCRRAALEERKLVIENIDKILSIF